MIRKDFLDRTLKTAANRYQPPANLLQDEGRYVRTRLIVARDVLGIIQSVYDQVPTDKAYAIGDTASAAIIIAGASLFGYDNGLRMYLLDHEQSAVELPPRPLENAQYIERNNAITVKLTPDAWMMSQLVEDDIHLSTDSTLRYGFAILQAAHTHLDMELSFVDSGGKAAALTTNLPHDIDLTPPAL